MPPLKTKNASLALLFTAMAFGAQAKADLLGVYGGIGVWQTSISGEFSNTDTVSLSELGLDDPTNTTAFIALEHPIPALPNIRIAMTSINSEGASTISRDIILSDDFSFPANADTQSEIDLSHIDYTLYYEVMDNYISIDLGLTGRDFSGDVSLTHDNAGVGLPDTETLSIDGIIPMLYTKAQLDLPFTGWYLGATGNFLSFQDNAITDIEAKVGFMASGFGLDVGFDVGYRSFSIVAEPDDEEFDADLTMDGPYASLLVHF